MVKYLILIVFVALTFSTTAQVNTDSLFLDNETQDKEIFNSRIYTVTNKKKDSALPNSKVYESQGIFHSTYLILSQDSTYVYYSLFEVGFHLTFGKWSQLNNDTLLLNWDKQKTLKSNKDEQIYETYSKHSSSPTAMPMTNWLIRRIGEKLEPIR